MRVENMPLTSLSIMELWSYAGMQLMKVVNFIILSCSLFVLVGFKLGGFESIGKWANEELVFSNARGVLTGYLTSPSSYSESDSTLIWSGVDSDGDKAYIVRLSYEAKNVYGTPIAGCNYVSYSVDGEKIYWSETVGLLDCDGSWTIIEDQVLEMLKTAAFGLDHFKGLPQEAAILAIASLME